MPQHPESDAQKELRGQVLVFEDGIAEMKGTKKADMAGSPFQPMPNCLGAGP